MSEADLEEMGPIDYIVLEWPGRQPSGEAAPLIADLHDRGIIRVLDVAFMVKDEEGHVAAHVSCAFAKSRIAVAEPSNHILPPTLSGNQPLVPPAATSRIR